MYDAPKIIIIMKDNDSFRNPNIAFVPKTADLTRSDGWYPSLSEL